MVAARPCLECEPRVAAVQRICLVSSTQSTRARSVGLIVEGHRFGQLLHETGGGELEGVDQIGLEAVLTREPGLACRA
jgi:hypothetical protein